jgi:hypothetical protein
MATKKTTTEERAVLVTTKHRGVFFGYATDTTGDQITLKRARCCVRWANTRGFLGLTTDGPNKDCRIGPAADELQLRDITSVAICSPAAVSAWEQAPWYRG